MDTKTPSVVDWENRMRIALVGTAYPLRGGIAHYMALLFQTLRSRGHEVCVLSFKRQYPAFLFPGKTQKDLGQELIPIASTPILDSINPITWVKAFFWLGRVRPDMLLFKYWMPFFAPCYATLAFLAKLFLGIRVVYLCDNVVPHEKNLLDEALNRLGLGFVDGFIVQSRQVQRDLLSYKPNANYRFAPHPLYTLFPVPIPKKEARKRLNIRQKHVLLYFGYIRKYKGLRYLIEAMPDVVRELSVHLLVCGEFYEEREEILSRVLDLGLESHVTILDRFIPNEEVGTYFCACDLVVLPYVSATQSGIVQVAYHYDKPVVVTRVGGLPEVVLDEKTGFVVEPQNNEAISRAILRFYKEKREKDFTANIAQEKQKYSWDRMAEAVEKLGE
jgi:glycosyltransferase involved in cell wall biosynthesis